MSLSASLGHSISKDDFILIIDLDETLLSINSFPVWAKHSLVRPLALKIFIERKLLKKSHARTKNELQKLWLKNPNDKLLKKIHDKLKQKIRPQMQDILQLIADGVIDAVLASAAAGVYVDDFAKNIGFKHILSTGIDEEENRHEEKSRRICEFLEKNNFSARKKIFFTDHIEDLPFILKCDKLIWFGSEDEIATIKQSAPHLNITLGKKLSADKLINEILQ